jgi:uncharacterized SAM-binding protein YcdF (DUF218 family)
MIFVLSKLLWIVLRPSSLLLMLAAIGSVLVFAGRARAGRWWLLAGVGGLICVLALPLGRWALEPLEDRFAQVATPPETITGIVVLGGAVDPWITEDRGIPALNREAERMTTAVALARRYPAAPLVFTGGSGEVIPGAPREAPAAALLFEELGIAPARIVLEGSSRTTWENALATRDLVHPLPGQVWVLVTSAAHMPRAVGAFRQAGWNVLPWPVAFHTTRSGRTGFAPTLANRLALLDLAAHEWTGLVAYRLLGRSDALFPR